MCPDNPDWCYCFESRNRNHRSAVWLVITVNCLSKVITDEWEVNLYVCHDLGSDVGARPSAEGAWHQLFCFEIKCLVFVVIKKKTIFKWLSNLMHNHFKFEFYCTSPNRSTNIQFEISLNFRRKKNRQNCRKLPLQQTVASDGRVEIKINGKFNEP